MKESPNNLSKKPYQINVQILKKLSSTLTIILLSDGSYDLLYENKKTGKIKWATISPKKK